MNKDYIIRHERKSEYFQVENLCREAFWNVYRPGCLEHYVLHCLRDDLIPGYLNSISGEYSTPAGYFVDEKECEIFDKQFPPKEKLKLPGQLW